MSPEARQALAAALKRQDRQDRRAAVTRTVRSVHRHWWYAAGTIAVMTVGAVGCRSWQQSQRDTALALAAIAAPATTPTSAPVATAGMPNPLDAMSLTAMARWVIGTTEDGVTLKPKRSATVVQSMLETLKPCELFIGLDDRAAVVVSRDPRPGFVPLATCAPASSTPSTTTKAAS